MTCIIAIIGYFIGFISGRFFCKENKKPTEEPKQETNAPKSPFKIQFYPETKKYVAVYKDSYLQKDSITGIVKLLKEHLFYYANFFDTQEEAKQLISLFKEQRLKENVKTFNIE